jgi:predicted nuclease of predicted toxin-antitoxin system
VAQHGYPADEPGVRLLVDENLSPRLVSVAHDRGYDATSVRDRDLLGVPDAKILQFCGDDDRVCVTNNADDFRELVGNLELHPGLIVMPNVARDRQAQLLDAALAFIEQEAAATSQSPRDLMLNHVVEVDSAGTYLVPRRARSSVSVTAPSTATPAFNDSESLPVASRLVAAYARHP